MAATGTPDWRPSQSLASGHSDAEESFGNREQTLDLSAAQAMALHEFGERTDGRVGELRHVILLAKQLIERNIERFGEARKRIHVRRSLATLDHAEKGDADIGAFGEALLRQFAATC